MNVFLYILLGLVAGTVSGMIGIGGGIIIVPALVILFGYSQHLAQGTTLALMVAPIGILGAWTYYRAGAVDIKTASFIALGFLMGSLLGAKISIGIPDIVLERIFGFLLLLIAMKMIFFPK